MRKIIKLTEGDLSRIVKRVLKEDVEAKIEQIYDSPKLDKMVDNFLSKLSDEQIKKLTNNLDQNGILDAADSLEDVKDIVKTESGVDDESTELSEQDDENKVEDAGEILDNVAGGLLGMSWATPLALFAAGLFPPTYAGYFLGLGATVLASLVIGKIGQKLRDDSPYIKTSSPGISNGKIRKMRPDNTYEDEPEKDPIKNKGGLSGEKDGTSFYWNPQTGEKKYFDTEKKKDDLPKGWAKTIDESYRRKSRLKESDLNRIVNRVIVSEKKYKNRKNINEGVLMTLGGIALGGAIVKKAYDYIKNRQLRNRMTETGEVKKSSDGKFAMKGFKDNETGEKFWGIDITDHTAGPEYTERKVLLFNDDPKRIEKILNSEIKHDFSDEARMYGPEDQWGQFNADKMFYK